MIGPEEPHYEDGEPMSVHLGKEGTEEGYKRYLIKKTGGREAYDQYVEGAADDDESEA